MGCEGKNGVKHDAWIFGLGCVRLGMLLDSQMEVLSQEVDVQSRVGLRTKLQESSVFRWHSQRAALAGSAGGEERWSWGWSPSANRGQEEEEEDPGGEIQLSSSGEGTSQGNVASQMPRRAWLREWLALSVPGVGKVQAISARDMGGVRGVVGVRE